MQPINLDHAEVIDYLTAERMIRDSGGKFFRVEFIKRSNGEYRRMIARVGVKPSNPSPKGTGYDPVSHGLIRVWEPVNGYDHVGNSRDDGYRMVGVERIKALRIRGRTYRVVAPGS